MNGVTVTALTKPTGRHEVLIDFVADRWQREDVLVVQQPLPHHLSGFSFVRLVEEAWNCLTILEEHIAEQLAESLPMFVLAVDGCEEIQGLERSLHHFTVLSAAHRTMTEEVVVYAQTHRVPSIERTTTSV